MKSTFFAIALSILSCSASAQAPAGAPAGSTGVCKDGSYSNAASKRGACAGHKGVKEWYEAESAPAPKAASTAPSPKAEAPAPVRTAMPAPKQSMPSAAAAGGGNGQVWVNTKSKVYHCEGDRYYGKTKTGSYMTESAAITAGNHADHGKACKAG